jgi:hypothetical protein
MTRERARHDRELAAEASLAAIDAEEFFARIQGGQMRIGG